MKQISQKTAIRMKQDNDLTVNTFGLRWLQQAMEKYISFPLAGANPKPREQVNCSIIG